MVWTFQELLIASRFGAAGNVNTSTPTAFTDTIDAPFVSGDANTSFLGIVGAGVGAANLKSTITAFTSASAVTLGTGASTTVTNANYAYSTGGQCDTNGTTTLILTFAVALAVGDLICVIPNTDQGTISSVSDSAGNSYSSIGSIGKGEFTQAMYWAPVTVAAAIGATVTCTFSSGTIGNGKELYVYHFSPPNGTRPILSKSAFANGSGTALSSGNITTAYPNELLISGECHNQTITASTAGWTASAQDKYAFISEYTEKASAGTVAAATYTQDISSVWNVVLASFAFVPLQTWASFPDRVDGQTVAASIRQSATWPTLPPAPPIAPNITPPSYPDRIPPPRFPRNALEGLTLPPKPNTTAAAPYEGYASYPDPTPRSLFMRTAMESCTRPVLPPVANVPTNSWAAYPDTMPVAREPMFDLGGFGFQTLVDDLGVDWCYPDRILPAPFPRGALEANALSPKPIATAAAPYEGYAAFPDRMPQPSSLRALHQDAFSPGFRPERTAPLVDTEYPERLPGPRQPQQMPTAALPLAPERTAPLVDTEYPERVVGRPYPTAQQQFATEPPLAPERTAPMVATSYPDSVLGPIEPQQVPVASLPLAPERTSTFAQQVYPDRMPRAQPVAQYQDQAAKPLAPERTAPLVDTEYPDRVPGARAVAYQQPSAAGPVAPIVAVAAPIEGYASYPDTVPGPRQPQHLHWTEISPKPIAPPVAPVVGYGSFPDTVPGPRQPLQQPVAAFSPAPERSSPLATHVFPDRMPRAQTVAQQQDSAALPRAPERTATLVATSYQDRIDGRGYPTVEQSFATEPPLAPERTAPMASAWYPDQILRPGMPTAAQMYAALYPLPIAAATAPSQGYTQYPDMLRGPQQPQHLYAAELPPKPIANVAPTFAYTSYPDSAMLPAGFRAAYQQFAMLAAAPERTAPIVASSYPDLITRPTLPVAQHVAWTLPLPPPPPPPVPTNPLVWYPDGLVRLKLFALQQSYSVAVGFGLIRPAIAILAPVSRLIQPVASTTLVRPVSPTARLGRP